jgi:UDP-glucuronate 4-epimerase
MVDKSWRVLVTGAAGFIGFHVAKELASQGCTVIGLDNFCPYYDIQLKKDRCTQIPNVKIYTHNVEDAAYLSSLVKQEHITHIVHLAAQAGVRHSLIDPASYTRSNIDGFLSVLEAARSQPAIVTVYASSSSVYGTNRKIPFAETDVTDSPSNLYGATKKANELMAHAYHHLFHLSLIGLRFFTVYGPWGRPDMSYYSFATKMMQRETLDLYDGGKLRRDFTYIDDIVAGIIGALSAPKPFAIYNLGNSHSEQVIDLVRYLEKYLGIQAKVRSLPRPATDIEETLADCSCAQQDLSFLQKTSLETGISQFSKWFLSYYRN